MLEPDNGYYVTLSIVILACAITAPLLAHLRQWQPAALFAVAALVYAIGGIAVLVLSNIQEAEPQSFRATFEVVARAHFFLNLSIFMAFIAAITWLQTRFGAMLYPRMTKILFWMLQLGVIGESLALYITPPGQRVGYSEYLETFSLVGKWASFSSSAAWLGLIGLLLWSWFQTWRARRA